LGEGEGLGVERGDTVGEEGAGDGAAGLCVDDEGDVLVPAVFEDEVERAVAQGHSGGDDGVGRGEHLRHVVADALAPLGGAQVEVAGQADAAPLTYRGDQRVHHADERDRGARRDVEESGDGGVPGAGPDLRGPGGQGDGFGAGRVPVRQHAGEVGVEGGDPDGGGGVAQQVGEGVPGGVLADFGGDFAGLEGAGAEDRAGPQHEVVVVVGDVAPGEPGGVVQPEGAGDVQGAGVGAVGAGQDGGGQPGDGPRLGVGHVSP